MSRRYFRPHGNNGDGDNNDDNDGMGSNNSGSSDEEHDLVQSLQQSTYRSSLFSSGRSTYDTQSSAPSSSPGQPKGFLSSIDSIGKPLRVMAADRYTELSRTGTNQSNASSSLSFSTRRRRSELSEHMVDLKEEVERDLEVLSENLLELVDSVNQITTDVSKATIRIVELLDASVKRSSPLANWDASSQMLHNVNKVCLQFHDTFLRFNAYQDSRRLLMRALTDFQMRLGFNLNVSQHEPVPYLHNFAICDIDHPNISKVELIMQRLISSSSVVSDQQGAFVAPVLRGLVKSTSVLSIMFGFPEPQQDHYEVINSLFETFPDIHFFVVKNHIKLAGGTKFHTPFRVPSRTKPEISISISASNSVKSSGTLGGYIAPKVSNTTDKSLLKYKGAKFALTCAHVLLGEDQNYPKVSVPSTVMLNAYKSALRDEMDRYAAGTVEHDSYASELASVDKYNLELGQVVWGERILLKPRLSDLAIVKVNEALSVENYLGDDCDSFHPSLKFQNAKIKKVIPTKLFSQHSKVFKVGTATKYTTGELNGLKMVYWLDGSLQTSEFVVSSHNEPMFASGGDSGSLVLHDLERETGLGVAGMLHSYDGERKELGLFTPAEELLGRLKEVTGVEWGFI